MTRARRALLWFAVLGVAAAPAAGAPEGHPNTLDDCARMVREQPGSYDAYYCFWAVARRDNGFAGAAARLEALLAADPGDDKARLYLGLVEADQAVPHAKERIERAAAGFAARGDFKGEVYARQSLVILARTQGRTGDIRRELARASAAATASGDPALVLRVRIEEGITAHRDGDPGRAYAVFKQAEKELTADLPRDLRRAVYDGIATAAFATSRYREALDACRREAEHLRAAGDRFAEAAARVKIVTAARMLDVPRDVRARLVDEALDAARSAGNRFAEVDALLQAGHVAQGREKRAMYEDALRLARRAGYAPAERLALASLGGALVLEAPKDVDRGLALLEEATRLARRSGSRTEWLEVRWGHARLLWEAGRVDEARRVLPGLIEETEQVSELSREAGTRGRVFARFAPNYEEFAGRVLRADPGAEAIAFAFELSERMRARTLLERLGDDPPAAADTPARRARTAALAQIAAVQRRLIDPRLDAGARDRAVDELERLEALELALREEQARADPAWDRARRAPTITLAGLQAALAPDQALLSFLTARHTRAQGAGSWLLALTRDRARAYELPPLPQLEDAVGMFLSLVERRDGSESAAAAHLYEDLVGPALRDLPGTVRRVVLVPDDVLHLLPFDLLRAGTRDPSFGERCELSVAPSATVWRLCAAQPAPPGRSGVVAVADPEVGMDGLDAADTRLFSFAGAAGLGRLPRARDEVRALRRVFGGDVIVRDGAAATEAFVKATEFARYGILHIAAHAMVDDKEPERSAILLVPGAAGEDGLLQFREIPRLELGGRTVVLSACRSAGGELLWGEGPLGLAQAFFQAGARTVVGSLWPVRDDESAPLFAAFYAHIARGRSLAAAMSAARRDRSAAGAPAAAWAGYVVLGDGDWVPLPGGRAAATPRWDLTAALVAICGALLVVLLRRGHPD